VVVCLERGADLHMAQLISLPLIISCSSKIQIGFTCLVPAHLGSPGQRAVKRVCVCVCDVERVCAVVRHVSESERDSVADVASAAGDGGYDVHLNIASTSTRTVSDNYVSPADIAYTATYQCICWIFAEVFRVRPQSIVMQQWFAASAVVHITVVMCFCTSRFKIPPVACKHYDMCMISDMLYAYSAAVVVAAMTVTIAAS